MKEDLPVKYDKVYDEHSYNCRIIEREISGIIESAKMCSDLERYIPFLNRLKDRPEGKYRLADIKRVIEECGKVDRDKIRLIKLLTIGYDKPESLYIMITIGIGPRQFVVLRQDEDLIKVEKNMIGTYKTTDLETCMKYLDDLV